MTPQDAAKKLSPSKPRKLPLPLTCHRLPDGDYIIKDAHHYYVADCLGRFRPEDAILICSAVNADESALRELLAASVEAAQHISDFYAEARESETRLRAAIAKVRELEG